MILRIVQGREVHPVGLDLGAIGNIEANRGKNLFNPPPGTNHRMDRADTTAASRQGDIDRFRCKALAKCRIGNLLTTTLQERFNFGFCCVDFCAEGFSRLSIDLTECF